jgi:polysaccharide biosynthesis protein PslG
MGRYLQTTLIALTLICVAAPAAEARVPRGFFGVVNDSVIGSSPRHLSRDMRTQSSAGAGTLRQTFDWSLLEPSPGRLKTRVYDRLVLAAAKRRIRVLPLLINPPAWASSRPRSGARRGIYPPSSYDSMGRFAALMVARYGPRGSLWKRHPKGRKWAIRSWQVWNEPNIPVYWASGPNATQYTHLLFTVKSYIKAFDPRADVLAAGLPNSNLGVPFRRYLKGMYQAGGKEAFDTLSIHPYAKSARGTISAVRYVRRLMNRYGDRKARIWVTEFGWSTSGPKSVFKAGPYGQARRIRSALRGLAKRRHSLHLRGVIYYNLRDIRRPRGQKNFFGLHTGLLGRSGRHKPGYRAYKRTARRLER